MQIKPVEDTTVIIHFFTRCKCAAHQFYIVPLTLIFVVFGDVRIIKLLSYAFDELGYCTCMYIVVLQRPCCRHSSVC